MLDPRPLIRGLHSELLARGQHDAQFQTAGGMKMYADAVAAELLLGMGEGQSILAAHDAASRETVAALCLRLAQCGVASAEIDEIASVPAAAMGAERWRGELAFDRHQAATAAMERLIALAHRHEAASGEPAVRQLIEQLYASDSRFQHDWMLAARALAMGMVGAEVQDVALDPRALAAHLASLMPSRDAVRVENLRLLPGAHSREVWFLDVCDAAGQRDSLVLRRDRQQNVTAGTVADEQPVMEALQRRGVPVARILSCGNDPAVLGRPFLIMQRCPGRPLAELVRENPSEYLVPAGKLLAELHRTPIDGLAFPARGVAAPLAATWTCLIEDTWTVWRERRPAPSLVVERAYRWLLAHAQRAAQHVSFVHGDYKLENLLVEDGRITAVLDLECSHCGNPAEDLIAFRHSVEPYVAWDAFLDAYLAAGGIPVTEDELAFASVWTPFLYCSFVATAYDTFARQGGFDLATGAPVLVHLPYLLEFLSAALDRHSTR